MIVAQLQSVRRHWLSEWDVGLNHKDKRGVWKRIPIHVTEKTAQIYETRTPTSYVLREDLALGIDPVGYVYVIRHKGGRLALENGRIALDHILVVDLRLEKLLHHCKTGGEKLKIGTGKGRWVEGFVL